MKNRSALVAFHDPAYVELAKDTATLVGYKPVHSTSNREGLLSLCKQYQPDAVFCDANLSPEGRDARANADVDWLKSLVAGVSSSTNIYVFSADEKTLQDASFFLSEERDTMVSSKQNLVSLISDSYSM